MKRTLILTLIFAFVFGACSSPEDIEVHQAWVRPTMQGENAAIYLTIHNHTADADELIGATSPAADVIEVHESKLENDIMQMSKVTALPLGPDEEVIFKPGGYHMMLINLKQELVLGQHIGLVLKFKNHDDIVVEVHVENSTPEEEHEAGEDH